MASLVGKVPAKGADFVLRGKELRRKSMTKYIFVTGGVVSGLGKGITAASLGRLLKARGLKVAAQKLDPYINVDPGTMSPFQHGEVYVTEDGKPSEGYVQVIDGKMNNVEFILNNSGKYSQKCAIIESEKIKILKRK